MNSLCGKRRHTKTTTATLNMVCCGVVSFIDIILHLYMRTLSLNAAFQGTWETVLAQEQ